MKGKNVLSMAMIAALTLGSLATGTSSTVHADSTSVKQEVKKEAVHKQGPFDLAVANEEKLIEMLKENGKISKDASAKEVEKELNQFLKEKSDALKDMESKGELNDEKLELEKEIKDKLKNDNDKKAKDNGRKGGKKLGTVVEEDYHGDVRSDNVLVLLVEFPDFPHNSIQPDESDMYYEDYVKEHYQNMIFGENGYEGPNGENLVSMKQFYEEQTDGAYTVNGTVAGWYMASKNAAAYGGKSPSGGNDVNARGLVKEALTAAGADPSVNLADYDQEDRYDLDGDGNFREADGLIDHLMVVHSAVGEEAGGGQLGEDAIWSHRWNLGGIFPIAGSPEPEVDYWGEGSMYAYDYTIEPADGAAGVFAHEYGHDLGLPDEYDTQYSGAGEAVSYWSIMASGSWAGKLPGTEPTGFSAWSKEFLQAAHGGNWLKYDEVDLEEIDNKGLEVYLDQANTKGTNLDALRINLPDKETQINAPYSGEFEYFSGSADGLNNSAVLPVDLTNVSNGELSFKTWYDIETDWDYGSVQVSEDGKEWTTIPGNITTETDPNEANPGHGITGSSEGWVDGTFNLNDYAGKEVFVKFNYLTDGAVSNPGFYIDDVLVTGDGNELFFDDAEGTPKVDLQGFTKDNGVKVSEHYYLLEWRNHQGVDKGLDHIRRGASLMSFEPGLVVWYADNKYSENWTGAHPGEGFLGVVDADQHELFWSDGTPAQTRYQIHDAAFSLRKDNKMFIDYSGINGLTMTDKKNQFVKQFDDSKSYLNEAIPDAGRNVTEYGLKFKVTGEATDRSVGRVSITRK